MADQSKWLFVPTLDYPFYLSSPGREGREDGIKDHYIGRVTHPKVPALRGQPVVDELLHGRMGALEKGAACLAHQESH